MPVESQEDILASALASLTEADVPPDEDWLATGSGPLPVPGVPPAGRAAPGGGGLLPDPDTGRPAEFAGLAAAELDELAAAAPAPVPEVLPAGCLPRDGTGRGAGFADGGPLDVLAAGAALGGLADDAHRRLGSLTDDELVGVLRAWRRQASWAQAREAAAVTELARRRPAPRSRAVPAGELPEIVSEFLGDEVAMALTLTRSAAADLVGLALDLHARPATAAALEAGRIDLRKARLLLDAVRPLSGPHAAAVEAAVLPEAQEIHRSRLLRVNIFARESLLRACLETR